MGLEGYIAAAMCDGAGVLAHTLEYASGFRFLLAGIRASCLRGYWLVATRSSRMDESSLSDVKYTCVLQDPWFCDIRFSGSGIARN